MLINKTKCTHHLFISSGIVQLVNKNTDKNTSTWYTDQRSEQLSLERNYPDVVDVLYNNYKLRLSAGR